MPEPPRSTPPQPPSPAPNRRRYTRPTLVEYGSIEKLTQGSATRGGDGSGGAFRRNG